jgi:putative ABC transport system permease protein
MRLWNGLRSWLRAILRGTRLEKEMDAELRFHIEAFAEDLVRSGVPRQEALRRARIEFGGIERAKEECRDARGTNFIESLIQDLRYGQRMLLKNPGFTTVAVLTLAVGIGASTSVFSLVNAVLIRLLPYPHPDRLVYLWSPNPRFALPIEYLTPMTADFFDLQSENHSFASLALFGATKFNVAADGRADALARWISRSIHARSSRTVVASAFLSFRIAAAFRYCGKHSCRARRWSFGCNRAISNA